MCIRPTLGSTGREARLSREPCSRNPIRSPPPVARVVVHVMPKAEILDPQGQAIVGALGRLGYDGISDVRQGKRFELEVDDSVADEMVAEIAESLLANVVIEDWSVSREQS